MTPFTTLTSIAVPLIRDNVDTDTIIPSREMKSTGKTGLADGLFAPWRYVDAEARTLNPDFVLNDREFCWRGRISVADQAGSMPFGRLLNMVFGASLQRALHRSFSTIASAMAFCRSAVTARSTAPFMDGS
jgi:hypothetical protein